MRRVLIATFDETDETMLDDLLHFLQSKYHVEVIVKKASGRKRRL